MFAVLNIEPYDGGFLKSISRFLVKKDAEITYHSVEGSTSYVSIKTYETSKGVDWDEVRWCAGVYAEKLLVPEGVEIPCSCGVYKFVPRMLPMVMLFNNAAEMIKNLNASDSLSVSVFDKYGALAEKVDLLLEHVRYVKVYTDEITLYSSASQRIMDNFGAAVMVLPYNSQCEENGIAIADRYDIERMRKCIAVFCTEKLNCYSNLIYGNNMTVSGQYMKAKPQNIDAFEFVSALYELNGMKDVGDLCFSNLYFNAELIDEKMTIDIMREKIKSL